jgi:hypothetical protein
MNQTMFGLMHWACAGIVTDWLVYLGVALSMTLRTWQIWLRPVPHSLKAAAFSIDVLTGV